MGFVALEDGTQVRVGDIYGRNWVYVETFVNTREEPDTTPMDGSNDPTLSVPEATTFLPRST